MFKDRVVWKSFYVATPWTAHGQLNIDNGKLNSLSSGLDNSVVILTLIIITIIIVIIVIVNIMIIMIMIRR